METGYGHVLVVGGTGMLSGMTKWLAKRSKSLTLVARHPQRLATELGCISYPLDWSAPNAIDILPDRKFNLLISWLHKDGLWLARPFEDLLVSGGRSIRIHGSTSLKMGIRAKVDPNPRKDIRRTTVVLGWIADSNTRRWLSNREISDGVIEAIGTPFRETVVIGTAHAI